MTITPYLAMTAAEFAHADPLPQHMAWMACHFSPYGTGLSNLPTALPPGSMLIVNDITPIRGHDPATVCRQLEECIHSQQCGSVLLDFQHPVTEQMRHMTGKLLEALPCPTAASGPIAGEFTCPVLAPPCPPSVALQDHLATWGSREIWLELSSQGRRIEVTASGSLDHPLREVPEEEGWEDHRLHCHYCTAVEPDRAVFRLWRTWEDQLSLLEEAGQRGITAAVGLYQEFP